MSDDHPSTNDGPRHPWRGPLIFGVVAATLQMGVLLWIANC